MKVCAGVAGGAVPSARASRAQVQNFESLDSRCIMYNTSTGRYNFDCLKDVISKRKLEATFMINKSVFKMTYL